MSDRGKASFTTMDFSDGVTKNIEQNNVHTPDVGNVLNKGFENGVEEKTFSDSASRRLATAFGVTAGIGGVAGGLAGHKIGKSKGKSEANKENQYKADIARLDGREEGFSEAFKIKDKDKKKYLGYNDPYYKGIDDSLVVKGTKDAIPSLVTGGTGALMGGALGYKLGKNDEKIRSTANISRETNASYNRGFDRAFSMKPHEKARYTKEKKINEELRKNLNLKEISSDMTIIKEAKSPTPPAKSSPYKHSFEYGAEKIAENMNIPIERARAVRASQYRKHGVEPNSLKGEKPKSKKAIARIAAKEKGLSVNLGFNKVKGLVSKGILPRVFGGIKKVTPSVVPDDLKAGIDKVSKYNRLKTAEGYSGTGPAENTIMAKRQAANQHLSGLRENANAYRGSRKVGEPIRVVDYLQKGMNADSISNNVVDNDKLKPKGLSRLIVKEINEE